MDVRVVRVIFVVLALAPKGIWIAVYILLMVIVPHATTSEERAAAHGQPFNAQELIDGAKRNYAQFKDRRDWKRQWRRQRRGGRGAGRPPTGRWGGRPGAPPYPAGSGGRLLARLMFPRP